MKKIVVFSDSHGYADYMLSALEAEQPDMVIHLGDGAADLARVKSQYPNAALHNVCGNCDFRSDAPVKLTLSVEGVRIFITHGHEYGVKYDSTYSRLRYAAMEAEAQIALFGHTHRAYQDYGPNVALMNPGSIGRTGRPSYGVLQIENGAFDVSIRTA